MARRGKLTEMEVLKVAGLTLILYQLLIETKAVTLVEMLLLTLVYSFHNILFFIGYNVVGSHYVMSSWCSLI